MTDLITRARKEWCEATVSSDFAPARQAWDYVVPCPPEVVAALLDVVESLKRRDLPMAESVRLAMVAEAAITRALEDKA